MKRGGGERPLTLDEEALVSDEESSNLLGLDDALTRLAALDARLAAVVECRYFGGLTEDEIGAALGVTERTVRRDWEKARLLLRSMMGG